MPSIFDSASIEVTPEQTQAALADDSAQIVDVREPYEWEAGRIDGALHIELERLASNAGKIDTDRPVIFHCRLGARSARAGPWRPRAASSPTTEIADRGRRAAIRGIATTRRYPEHDESRLRVQPRH